jgi:hypothetical protein
MASKNAASWLVTVGGGPCPVCGLDGDVAFVPDKWARLKEWLVNGQAPRARLVCVNGHEWPAGSTDFLTAVGGRGWWRWPLKAIRVLGQHRTAEPVPLFWVVSAVVGVVVGVVAEVTLGWFWWLVTAVWLVLVWLMILATAFRYPGRADLWIDLVATVSPQRAQQLETKRLLQLVEGAPGPVYGLAEWEGPRQIGGHGRSSSAGLTRLELVYGSPLDEPHLKVNTIWKRRQTPDLVIENSRNRLIRDLWHRQVRPPDELDGDQRRSWMRKQHVDIDQRPIPDGTPTSISIEGTTHHAEVYREDEDWIAVVDAEPVLIEIESHQVPMDHLALAPVADLTAYTDGGPDQHRSSR